MRLEYLIQGSHTSRTLSAKWRALTGPPESSPVMERIRREALLHSRSAAQKSGRLIPVCDYLKTICEFCKFPQKKHTISGFISTFITERGPLLLRRPGTGPRLLNLQRSCSSCPAKNKPPSVSGSPQGQTTRKPVLFKWEIRCISRRPFIPLGSVPGICSAAWVWKAQDTASSNSLSLLQKSTPFPRPPSGGTLKSWNLPASSRSIPTSGSASPTCMNSAWSGKGSVPLPPAKTPWLYIVNLTQSELTAARLFFHWFPNCETVQAANIQDTPSK